MATITRRIGLSLGADICWPICYEDIVQDLDVHVPVNGDEIRFEVKRVTIEPFELTRPNPYDVVIDRLTHWYHTSREWIKKAIIMDGLYVFNNPWAVQSMEKHTTYCAMMRLGMPIPRTWLVPPKEYEQTPDLEPTLQSYAQLFDLGRIGDDLSYPVFMKPYDGGGWVGVTKIDDEEALRDAYEKSGKYVMHIQEGVAPYDAFVRCVGVGPQVRMVRYDPDAPLHDRYTRDFGFLSSDDTDELEDITLTINSFFGWDFNSCESLKKDGVWHPIDFANPCPDSQVTSLHVHFPWLVKAKIRWSLFCAAIKKPMRQNLDWQPYYDVAGTDMSPRERLAAYRRIAHTRFETDRFQEFCENHLGHLDEVADAYFRSDRAKDAIRKKVEALYPEDEWDEFTDMFAERVHEGIEQETARRAR